MQWSLLKCMEIMPVLSIPFSFTQSKKQVGICICIPTYTLHYTTQMASPVSKLAKVREDILGQDNFMSFVELQTNSGKQKFPWLAKSYFILPMPKSCAETCRADEMSYFCKHVATGLTRCVLKGFGFQIFFSTQISPLCKYENGSCQLLGALI